MSIKRPVVCHLLICHCVYVCASIQSPLPCLLQNCILLWLIIESLQYLAEVLNIFLLYYIYIFTGLVFLTVSIFSLPTSIWHSNIFNWQCVTPVGYFCYSFSTGYKIVLWSHREELRVGHQWNKKSCNGNI